MAVVDAGWGRSMKSCGRESRGKPSGPPPCQQGVVGYTTLAPAAAVVLRAGASGTTIARYRYVLRAGANKAWRYLFAGANVVYLTPPVLNTSVPNTDGGMGDTARFYGTM